MWRNQGQRISIRLIFCLRKKYLIEIVYYNAVREETIITVVSSLIDGVVSQGHCPRRQRQTLITDFSSLNDGGAFYVRDNTLITDVGSLIEVAVSQGHCLRRQRQTLITNFRSFNDEGASTSEIIPLVNVD